MKKINRKISGIIAVVFLGLSLVGCQNSMVTKSIQEGKDYINNKQYMKAQDALQDALDQDSNNKEANMLMNIVSDYLGAVTHFQDGEYKKAEKELNEIPVEYKDFEIKDDIDNLKSKLTDIESKKQSNDAHIKKAQKFVKANKYKAAEDELKKIDMKTINKDQRGSIIELNKKINSNN